VAKITFIDHGGERREIDATDGISVMQNALDHDIPGIDADCGGGCACATCHVYVDDAFVEKLEPASELEIEMLDFAEDTSTNSRLACQLEVSEALDGLVVTTPESQH